MGGLDGLTGGEASTEVVAGHFLLVEVGCRSLVDDGAMVEQVGGVGQFQGPAHILFDGEHPVAASVVRDSKIRSTTTGANPIDTSSTRTTWGLPR